MNTVSEQRRRARAASCSRRAAELGEARV